MINQLLHEARWRSHWRWLLLVLMAVSAWFAFGRTPPGLPASMFDKVQHVAAFAAMGLAAALSLPAGWRHSRTAAVGLVGYGAFIELVQTTLPWRSAEFGDLLADAAGSAAGLPLAAALRKIWQPLD